MKESQSSDSIVCCADEMRNLFWNGIWKKYVAILVIWVFFLIIAWLVNATWPQVIGLILIIAVIGVPHIIKIHRGYTGQLCSECGKPAGAFETRKCRVHLICKHCHAVTPTDCAIYWSGGPPYKIH